jgi:hypothetical protein
VSAGEWLVEMLAWAALETWWQRNPIGRTNTPPGQDHPEADVALWRFVRKGIWPELYDRLRTEHRRRAEALS